MRTPYTLSWNTILRVSTLVCLLLLPLNNYYSYPKSQSEEVPGTTNTIKSTIKSSVSDEFRNGVHERYLEYLAEKLDMNLEIIPMTYNRRLASLRDGNIDIMTGVRNTYETKGQFIYLQPSYSTSQNSYFIRSDGKTILNTVKDLNGLTIAITANEKGHVQALENLGAKVVVIGSLSQKILLLQKNRIDAFEHVESSAVRQIREKDLAGEIILAGYKSNNLLEFHFALSTSSSLMPHKRAIEAVIAEGVSNGDFTAIREGHYLSAQQNTSR
jgi:ABC-type amino acid transport substrate-binding protein